MNRYVKFMLLLSTLILVSGDLLGQNILPNPGFEYSRRPIKNWMLTGKAFNASMINWISPNSGSPDVLRQADLDDFIRERPNVNIDTYRPRTGGVMIGIKLYGCEGGDHCKEYIQVPLRDSLEIGKRYRFEFWTKPITTSVKINNIGALFSVNRVSRIGTGIYDYVPTINAGTIVDTTDGAWIRIADTICVDSSYQFLTIGNFYPDDQTQANPETDGIEYAYYLFDDIYLEKISEDCESVLVADILDTRNIQFATDRAALKPASFVELDKLVSFLKRNPERRIRIEGHTDDVGTQEYNLKLSSARANAVLAYVVGKGVSKDRLIATGLGSSVPIATNAEEAGRRLNRRVEIILMN